MSTTKLRGLLRLFRFELPFSAGICVMMGALLALGRFPTVDQLLLGFLSVFFISAATLILNDYFDLEVDRINMPNRPLPSGQVTARDVIALSMIVTLLGLAISALISLQALLVAILVWIVGFLYNWRFKRTGFLGNLMVSFSVGMTFIFGGLVVGLPFSKPVLVFAIIAALIDLGEEIAGDALDAQGDKHIGSRSLALTWGTENALKLSGALFLLMVIVSSVPFWLGWLGWLYGVPIVIMDALILYATAHLLNPRKAESRRRTMRWIYMSGLSGMVLFLLVRLADGGN
ncbi:MAG: UbiA family prenyltransferase [Anaerolineae bacterium]